MCLSCCLKEFEESLFDTLPRKAQSGEKTAMSFYIQEKVINTDTCVQGLATWQFPVGMLDCIPTWDGIASGLQRYSRNTGSNIYGSYCHVRPVCCFCCQHIWHSSDSPSLFIGHLYTAWLNLTHTCVCAYVSLSNRHSAICLLCDQRRS